MIEGRRFGRFEKAVYNGIGNLFQAISWCNKAKFCAQIPLKTLRLVLRSENREDLSELPDSALKAQMKSIVKNSVFQMAYQLLVIGREIITKGKDHAQAH